jgi:hypothetical protein
LANGLWKARLKPTNLCEPVRLSAAKQIHWGRGGFYVERRGEGQLGTNLDIITYDSHAKVYTSYYANSVGLVGAATGSVNGNTWTWVVEDKFAGKAVKGRLTMTTLSPTQCTSKYEMADGKGDYTTIVEGKATKTGS